LVIVRRECGLAGRTGISVSIVILSHSDGLQGRVLLLLMMSSSSMRAEGESFCLCHEQSRTFWKTKVSSMHSRATFNAVSKLSRNFHSTAPLNAKVSIRIPFPWKGHIAATA
jgi:hypothetical protein